jgi:hypothetical protein
MNWTNKDDIEYCEAAAETDWDFEDIRFLKSLRKTTPPLLVDQSPNAPECTYPPSQSTYCRVYDS